MKTERKGISDVKLHEDMSHVDELPKGGDFMELNGTLIMGESQGYDMFLLVIAWRVGGGKNGRWMVDDVVMGQTTFAMALQSQWGKMQDGDFIGNRQNPTEWQGAIQIVQKSDRIIWQVGNRQFISRPPYWGIKGEHMGVESNLILGGLGKATRTYGPWSKLAETHRGGYSQRCWAEGTINVGGKKFALEKGYAAHDMMTFGETWDHKKNMAEPYNWIWCMNDSMQIFLWTQPGAGVGYGRVYINDREFAFEQNEIALDELEWWTDPKTSIRVPVRWHITMSSAEVILDMKVAAGARSIFCVFTRTGYTMRYSNIARTSGRISLQDGHSVAIDNILTYAERSLAFVPFGSGIP